MRLGSVLSEALRNIGSGVSRAFAMFLAVLLSGTLLGGYEAMTVIDLESQAVQRINAYADVNAIVGGTVDGTACDRLSDAGDGMTGTLAGAMRAGEQVVPLATPGKDISSYDVTPGMIRLIAGNAKADVSGVWVPRDVAKDFGLAVGSALRTREGTTRVAGVFDWPNDGRDTRFAYAFIVPVSASASTFDECWVKQWPADGQMENLLYATLVAGSGSSNAGVTQVNKGFDAHYDARASYVNRSTRWMPWVGLAIGVLVGVCGCVAFGAVEGCAVAGYWCGDRCLGRAGYVCFVCVVVGVCGADEPVRLGGGVGGCGAYAVGCVRRCHGGESIGGVVDS